MVDPVRQCKFSYTDEVRDTIVAPVLRRAVGPYFKLYDLRAPDVSPYTAYNHKTSFVLLTFNPKPAGQTPTIGVVFDPCRKRAWVPIGPIE
jgi:hypothetical protein